jgi:VCBS repeat-containing protein
LFCAFTDTSTDSDGTVTGWLWNFGDGSTSTAQSPSGYYAAADTYTVTLTVTDNGGATDVTSQSVTVSSSGTNQAPVISSFTKQSLNAAAQMFVGEHSFLAFAKSGQPERGEMCTVTKAQWSRWSCGVQFDVTANRFLHHMVRYMVGTMVDVALQRRPASDIDRLLHDRGSLDTSPPAPAEGLFLSHVEY